jgi:hypothetical protein
MCCTPHVCSTQSLFRSLMHLKPPTNAKHAVTSGERCMLSGEWYVDGRIELECLLCWDVLGQCIMLLGTATTLGSANYASLVDSLDVLLSRTKSNGGYPIRLHLLFRSKPIAILGSPKKGGNVRFCRKRSNLPKGMLQFNDSRLATRGRLRRIERFFWG